MRGNHKPSHGMLNSMEIDRLGLPPASRLIVSLPACEGVGTKAYDVSLRGSRTRDATRNAGAVWAAVPNCGYGLRCTGTLGDFWSLPVVASVRGQAKYTMEMIVNIKTLATGNDRRYIYAEESSTAGNIRLGVWYEGPTSGTDNQFGFNARGTDAAGSAFFKFGPAPLVIGKSYHLVISHNAAGTTVAYLDGVSQASSAMGLATVDNTAPVNVQIGQIAASATTTTDGAVGLVNLWGGVAMTSEQVRQRYQDPYSMFWPEEDGLVGIAAAATGSVGVVGPYGSGGVTGGNAYNGKLGIGYNWRV